MSGYDDDDTYALMTTYASIENDQTAEVEIALYRALEACLTDIVYSNPPGEYSVALFFEKSEYPVELSVTVFRDGEDVPETDITKSLTVSAQSAQILRSMRAHAFAIQEITREQADPFVLVQAIRNLRINDQRSFNVVLSLTCLGPDYEDDDFEDEH